MYKRKDSTRSEGLGRPRYRGLPWMLGVCFLLSACNKKTDQTQTPAAEGPVQGWEDAILTHAPEVPPPITRTHPTRVTVKLEIKEVEKELAPGVRYVFWTFGGSVPGMFIRVREGDLVDFHLSNHQDNKMPHNIDLHAVTGPGGGAAASVTAPGHTSVFSFTAKNPGLFVYHCATAPVGMHIANGMYGLIYVQPKEALPKVDHEYYIMQSEFYTQGKNRQEGLQAFDMEKAVKEDADYVVFNGAMGALNDDKALTAKVGETVRLFIGNGGPGLISSFHVIGEVFDRVHSWGGANVDQEQVQTVLIPSGGSVIAELGLDFPATYLLVDHSIFRAFNKGAMAMLKVTGPTDSAIYSGKQRDEVYHAEGSAIQTMPNGSEPKPPTSLTRAELMDRGSRVFNQVCAACHQANAEGLPQVFPPLAKSDFLLADKNRAIDILLHGKTGLITVNGQQYNGVMPELNLDDASIASVLTYVRNSFGNSSDPVTIEEVKAHRR